MAETDRAADDLTDRELLAEIWEIACGLEALTVELRTEVGELRGKVAELESEFGPVARRYRRLVPGLARAASNGRASHGD